MLTRLTRMDGVWGKLNTCKFFVFMEPSIFVVYLLFTNANVQFLGIVTGKPATFVLWTLENGEQPKPQGSGLDSLLWHHMHLYLSLTSLKRHITVLPRWKTTSYFDISSERIERCQVSSALCNHRPYGLLVALVVPTTFSMYRYDYLSRCNSYLSLRLVLRRH